MAEAEAALRESHVAALSEAERVAAAKLAALRSELVDMEG
eukprot:SAG11_NODE_42508_length_179_cov_26.425000_1_plen_39_part_10